MHFATRSRPRTRNTCAALLLAFVPFALVVPSGEVASGQTGTGASGQVPLFTAIDLNPDGFVESWASGTSDGWQVGYGYGPATGGYGHALLWRGTPTSVVDLHPSGFMISRALGISGGKQVGVGVRSIPGGGAHALLWSGSAASVVDLHPSGFVESEAFGISGGHQVGYGYGPATGEHKHALLWQGTPASVVDLHPGGFDSSEALGASGAQQVGYGSIGGRDHALVWQGDARTIVDLGEGKASATSGGQQVGEAPRAVLWRGTAGTMVDLTPGGFYGSAASGTSGGEQVGYGGPWGTTHALLWRGDVGSLVDLHSFLPPGFEWSFATGIDANGDIVGFAEGPATQNRNHAILWTRNANARPSPAPPIDKFMTFYTPGMTPRTLSVAVGDEAEVIVMDPLGQQFHPQKSQVWELGIPNQMAGQYTLDVIGRVSGHFSVEVGASNASGDSLRHIFEGTTAQGRITRFTFPGEVTAFAAFGARVKINSSSKSLEVNGTFTLAPGASISPMTQPVTIETTRNIWTIQPGSFRKAGQEMFVFEGTFGGDALKANLTRTGGTTYSFKFEGTGITDLPDAKYPVDVQLAIGNNVGSTHVNAELGP